MSSINQLVSEIAHSLQQPNSVPVRRAIKLGIVHARADLIRKSYSNHNYTDKVLKQRFRLELIPVCDGDVNNGEVKAGLNTILRTNSKVPRPVRLTNNLPFHSVRTAGVINPIAIPYVSEGAAKFYKHLPGMDCSPTYDYINGYIYIEGMKEAIKHIVVESVFDYPNGALSIDEIDDDDEFFVSEDFIEPIKKTVIETFNPNVIREDDVIPNANLVR